MQTFHAVFGVLFLIATLVLAIYSVIHYKKTRKHLSQKIYGVSIFLFMGLYFCMEGGLLPINKDTMSVWRISFYCLLVVTNFPIYRDMWKQHKAEKAAQAAQRRLQAQEPPRLPERIGNR